MKFLKGTLLLLLVLAFSHVSAASQEEEKLREPYPGEEVTTQDGKKVRRWSTRGPVEVAPAPQPFDDPEQRRTPQGLLLNVDTHQIRQQQGTRPHHHAPGNHKHHPSDGAGKK